MSKPVELTDEEFLSLPRKLEILDGKLLITPEGKRVLLKLLGEAPDQPNSSEEPAASP